MVEDMTNSTPSLVRVICSTCGMPDHDGDSGVHYTAYGHFPTYSDLVVPA